MTHLHCFKPKSCLGRVKPIKKTAHIHCPSSKICASQMLLHCLPVAVPFPSSHCHSPSSFDMLLHQLLAIFIIGSMATTSFGEDTFLANDRCSVLLSGSRPGSVRSISFGCEQGALLWEHPSGPLLSTFQVPLGEQQQQLCIRFGEQLPEGTVIQRMVNGLLWSLPQLLSGGLHCLPVLAEEANRMQLFLRVQNREDAASIGLFYAFERISWEADKVQCGICSKAQFLDAFCTANFVFIGKLLQHSPDSNSLDFSMELPLIRRPFLVQYIRSQSDAQFNATSLFSNCPANDARLRSSLITRYVVVAKAQLGIVRLLCLMELTQFEAIPTETAPCDIRLRP